jgi:hypothetical protein
MCGRSDVEPREGMTNGGDNDSGERDQTVHDGRFHTVDQGIACEPRQGFGRRFEELKLIMKSRIRD